MATPNGLNHTFIGGMTVLGNATLGAAAKNSQNLLRGRVKIDERPTGGTTEDYALQIRSESAKTSGTHWGLDSETHLKATGTASIRGIQGVAVVDATFTATGATLIGTYGQVRADGTVAGSGFMAGLYGLVEEGGGAITASHVASAWLDSHRNTAVSGNHELLYMTNNGTAVMDQMIFVYGDAGSLINLDYATASTPAYITGPGTAASGTPLKIKLIYKGTPYYLNAYPTDNA